MDTSNINLEEDHNSLIIDVGSKNRKSEVPKYRSKDIDIHSENSYQVAIEVERLLNGFALP